VEPKRKCPVCGEMVASGKGFGGHMSKHSKKRKGSGRKTAKKAASLRRLGRESRGQRIARASSSAGTDLPQAPAQEALASVSAALRKAATQKRALAQQILAQARELEEMAIRTEKLL